MANYTKINLDLQSDLVLSNAKIDAVTGGLRSELDGILLSASAEETRALAAEAGLQGNINTLSTTVQGNYSTLDGAIYNEEQRAITAEGVLTNNLATEVSNRIQGDADTLADAKVYTNLLRDGKVADNAAAIDAEVTRAEAAEEVLDGKIGTEKGRIDAILSASSADKDTFAEIVTLINSVDLENDDALASTLLAEQNARISGDADTLANAKVYTDALENGTVKANTIAINAEVTRAEAAEEVLTNNLATEVSNRISGDADTLADAKAYADQAELDAIASAESKDAARYVTVTGDIADAKSEAIASASADATTKANAALVDAKAYADQAELDAIAAAEAKDAARATTTATNLSNAISTEVSARDAAILVEKNRAVLEEGVIAGKLSDEISRAIAAEEVLDGKIGTEKGRIDAILSASSADKDSFAEIVALINSVDVTNDDALAGYVLDNNAALATEKADRIAKDNLLSVGLDGEVSRATAAEEVLTNNLATEVSNRISGDADTLADAKAYADGIAGNYDANGAAAQALADAKVYADQAELDAIASAASDATTKANQALVDAKAYADIAESDAIASAKSYTDGRETAIKVYADIAVAALKQEVDDSVEKILDLDFKSMFAQKIGATTGDNQKYTLDKAVMGESLQVFENGLLLEEGADYSVNYGGGVNNAKEVVFNGYQIKSGWKVKFFGVPFVASDVDLIAG